MSPASLVLSTIVVSLRNLVVFATIAAGAYWLNMQDWSTDEPGKSSGSGELRQNPRNLSVLDLSWSADEKAFLSRSIGHSNGRPLVLLHRVSEVREAQFISTARVCTGEQRVDNALLLPDASAIVVVGNNRILRIEVESGQTAELLDVSNVATELPALAVSSDGSGLAVAVARELRLLDPNSGRSSMRLPSDESTVIDLAFSADDRRIAAGLVDGTIRVWDCGASKIVCDLSRHDAPVAAVRFVGGHRHLASIGMEGDGVLRLWNIESGELVWQVAADPLGLHALAVSVDGRLVATGGNSQEVVLWDLDERRRLRTFTGHTGSIKALRLSRDGETLTSCSSDGTICCWDVDSMELIFSIDVEGVAGPRVPRAHDRSYR